LLEVVVGKAVLLAGVEPLGLFITETKLI